MYTLFVRFTVFAGARPFDLAILVLKEKVIPNKKIQIANLPDENEPCPQELVLSGWGVDKTRDRSQRYLWAVKQECLDISQCPIYGGDKNLVICSGSSENNLNSGCMGDSGGRK